MAHSRLTQKELLARAVDGQNRAYESLLHSQQLHDAVMVMIGQVRFTAGSGGSMTSIGSEWTRWTGQDVMQAAFQGWLLNVHGDDLPVVRAALQASDTSATALDIDLRLRTAAGGYRWYRLRTAAMAHPGDDGSRWYGTFEDVDERHHANSRFERTQSALIHLSRLSAMGTMASTLAHELNQPLTTIANFVRAARRLVENGTATAMVSDALLGADKAAMRAGEIVRRVRELVVSGQVDKRPERLATIVQEACGLIMIDARLMGITYRILEDEALPPVMVDKVQIQQVLINLLRNSVEALATQPVRQITIALTAESPAVCIVSISDTGPGVPDDIAAKLFESFNTSKPGGSGIGLSICRTIVEAHGGTIWCEALSDGTKFAFTLPTADQGMAHSSSSTIS